jgi:Putative peptidoglycan binding domain
MPTNFKAIADFYLQKLIEKPKFTSIDPNTDQSLLVPAFMAKVTSCIAEYKASHPGQDITFTETYRSNALQLKHFNNHASKIKANGMHHYGIAGDSIFVIGGKKTYKGDVVGLRKIYQDNGLFILGMWDALHVQFIPVSEQATLRTTVKNTLIAFQKANGLSQSGEADAATIAMAKKKFP